MTDKPSNFIVMRKSALQRHWGHFIKWTRRINFRSKLEIILALISIALASATAYFFYQRAGPFALIEGDFVILLYVSIGFILMFAAFIVHRIVRLLSGKGGKLQGRIITYFGLMAVVPVVVLAIFSGLVLERGVQNWFSEPVRNTLNNSREVAEAYLVEHRMNIQGDLMAMAYDLNRQAGTVGQNIHVLQRLVEEQMAIRALNEAMVFDGNDNLLAMASTNLTLASKFVPREYVRQAASGEAVIISDTSADRVKAIIKLEGYSDAYLYVSRFVDPEVLAYLQATRDALSQYEALEAERTSFQLSFDAVFGIIAVLLLLGAVWVGYLVAGQMTTPIRRLATAAEKVGQGNFKIKLPAATSRDEIGTLSREFGRMTRKLESQQQDLVETNKMLDERRRFTEAVLSGVSAGVIGLDRRGNITLPNRAACEFLGKTRADLEGKRAMTVMPELKALLTRVLDAREGSAQGQVVVSRTGKERTLLVRIAAEGGVKRASGYVITFDDISEQLSDQRTAAWADVARRIAHEIKNPLTPIQLSTERLKRKYASALDGDDGVFRQCTDTIIRQVGDLRRMVDEFSSFARMPKPVFHQENLTDIIRQALFLQEVGAQNIQFEFKAPPKPVLMRCDGRQMAQAMTNILKNAVESIKERSAGPENETNGVNSGHISIAITETPGTVEVVVEDDGKGLPEDMIEKLMEPYVTTREKGTGLGLAIVKKIMEDHHGEIRLAKRKGGRGACVTLRFDLAALAGKTAGPARADEAREKARTHGA